MTSSGRPFWKYRNFSFAIRHYSMVYTKHFITPLSSDTSFYDFGRRSFLRTLEVTWRHLEAKFKKRAQIRCGHGSILYKTSITFGPPPFSREEIALKNGHIFNFARPVTLTLTSDDLETYIVRFVSSTSIQRYMVYVAPMKSSWTYVRTYGWTDIFPTKGIRFSQKEKT